MQCDVNGRRVVVAGGSRGIGRSIALAFAAGGAHVSICARDRAQLEATRAEIAAFGHVAHGASCDLASADAIAGYIPAAAAALGGLDVLVNNASGFGTGDDEASWDASIDVDLRAVVRASHAALPFLEAANGASIINIASGSGIGPSVRTPAYGAAKAAVIHYTRSQAAALIRRNIRVNCVAPGSIEFPGGVWDRRRIEDPALYDRTLANMPNGRMGTPEEVASVVVFLASPMANWVTAQIISINGGQGLG